MYQELCIEREKQAGARGSRGGTQEWGTGMGSLKYGPKKGYQSFGSEGHAGDMPDMPVMCWMAGDSCHILPAKNIA